jgi:hypothetical protein
VRPRNRTSPDVNYVSLTIDLALFALVATFWARARKQAAEARRARDAELTDTDQLRFSLPTLADGVPSVVSGTEIDDESSALTVMEDDWRQIEFRSSDERARVEEQIAAIRAHVDINRVGLGFREVLVRPDPAMPIAKGELTVAEIVREFGAPGAAPVYLRSGDGAQRAEDAFAVEVPGVGFVYGSERDGEVGTLGLAVVDRQPQLGEIDGVTRLSARFDLILVDWLRQEIVQSRDAEQLRAWLATFARDEDVGEA